MSLPRIILLFLLALALAAGLVAVIMDTGNLERHLAVEGALARWEALGGLQDPAATRPVDPRDNAALLYERAFALLPPAGAASSADADHVAEDIETFADATSVAREAAARRRCVWEGRRPERLEVTRLADALGAEAAALAASGDAAGAVERINALRALAGHLRAEADLELFDWSLHVDDAALHTLETLFRDRELPGEAAAGLVGHVGYADLARRTRLECGDLALSYFGEQYPSQWRADDMMGFLVAAAAEVEALGRPYAGRHLEPQPDDQPRWAGYLPQGLSTPLDRRLVSWTEARTRLFEVAVALRAHRARHGAYPARWPMPTDPMTGEPLGYRREGKGFVVFSSTDEALAWRWN